MRACADAPSIFIGAVKKRAAKNRIFLRVVIKSRLAHFISADFLWRSFFFAGAELKFLHILILKCNICNIPNIRRNIVYKYKAKTLTQYQEIQVQAKSQQNNRIINIMTISQLSQEIRIVLQSAYKKRSAPIFIGADLCVLMKFRKKMRGKNRRFFIGAYIEK